MEFGLLLKSVVLALVDFGSAQQVIEPPGNYAVRMELMGSATWKVE